MRIALVVYGSLEQVSGGYLYDREVVAQLRKEGVEVDLHSLGTAPYLLCVLHNLRPRLRRLLRRGRRGAVVYQAVVLDELVHPSVFLAVGRPNRLRSSGSKRPPVLTLVHHLKCRESLGALHRAAARCMERRLLRGSDGLLVNSRTTEASVRQLLVQSAPVWICPPGCDLQETARPGPARRVQAGQPPTLLTTGNLIPRKGHDLMLGALADLQDLPWRLRVVGRPVDSRYAARLRRLVDRRGLGDRVRFTGELGGARLAAEYAEADIFVFASRYEGYGISLAEALRAGLPFVAFASGAVPEVVGSESEPGLVAEGDLEAFRRTLGRMLSDRAFRAAAAARSREMGARLPTWQQTGECFLGALREAVSRV